MKKILMILTATLILSCHENEPKIVYHDNDKKDNNNPVEVVDDTTKKLIADLPFSFDRLEYIYFPIGETQESFKRSLKIISGLYSSGSKSYSLGYISGRNVNCDLDNIMIREKAKEKFHLLTKDNLKIKSLTYLYRLDTLHNKDRFVYRIIDNDSNRDGQLNDDDLVGLFTSTTNGKNLRRISPNDEQLIDWELWSIEGLLFYRTMEDIDRNGIFDENDRIKLYEYNILLEDSSKIIFDKKLYKEMK